MPVTYERDMRELAKKRKRGLLTIGWVEPGVGAVHTQGPATPEQIKVVQRAYGKLFPAPRRRKR